MSGSNAITRLRSCRYPTCCHVTINTEKGNTKEYAQKRFLAKDIKTKLIEDILLIVIKTIEKVVMEKNDPLPVIR